MVERAVSCNAIVIVIHNYVICMCVHAWLAVVLKVHVTWQGPFEIVKRKKGNGGLGHDSLAGTHWEYVSQRSCFPSVWGSIRASSSEFAPLPRLHVCWRASFAFSFVEFSE